MNLLFQNSTSFIKPECAEQVRIMTSIFFWRFAEIIIRIACSKELCLSSVLNCHIALQHQDVLVTYLTLCKVVDSFNAFCN